jgi:hypothetical protein
MKTFTKSIKKNNFLLIIILMLLGTCLYLYFKPNTELNINSKIDSIVVYKSKRQLLAYSNEQLIKTYKISLEKNPVGAKQ